MSRTRRPRGHLVAALAVVATAVAGCGDDTGVTPETTLRPRSDPSAYLVALRVALPPGAADTELPVVYVVPLEPIDLGMQAAIIDGLAETHDVRFVDDLAAAVDADQPGAPPRAGSTVIGLGTVSAEPPHLVRIERYHDAGDVEATLVVLVVGGTGWVVDRSESVPPEVLGDGP